MSTDRIGLALSGGGFRATLFHLGVARFLRDAGLLGSISHITSVSGGSIFGAHLCLNWDRYTDSAESFEDAADELVRFVQLDVRNRIMRRYPFVLAIAGARGALRLGRKRHLSRTGMLERHYEDHLFGSSCLFDLPATPQLHILTTNLSEGVLCSFSREGLIVQRRTPGRGARFERVQAGLATIAMAVTASSAFPGFFPPLRLEADDVGATEGDFPRQAFTDGGVFDNLGVRMFKGITESWIAHNEPLSGRDVDERGLAEALRAHETDADGPIGYLARRLASPGAASTVDEGTPGLPVPARSAQVDALWHIIVHARLYREPAFERVRLDAPDAQGYLEFIRSTGRDPEWGDHLWLNRQLLAAALLAATGKEVLSSGSNLLEQVLVSDAGKQFKVTPGRSFGGLVGTAMRSSDILMDRVWQLEKEIFEAAPGFVSVPISRVVDPALDPHGLHPEIQRQVARIRTDLDRFSSIEISGLVRHGYCVARATLADDPHLEQVRMPDGPPWDPIAAGQPRKGSHTGRRGREAEEARRLQSSSQRRIVGALFAWDDLASYAYVPLLICLAAVPYWVWQIYDRMQAANQVIAAISDSSPDVQTVLELLQIGPPAPWESLPVDNTADAPVTDLTGFDVLGDTRIVDLRMLASNPLGERFAYAYARFRVSRKSNDGSRRVTVALPTRTDAVLIRSRNARHDPRVHRWRRPEAHGPTGTMPYEVVYGVSFDLGAEPPGTPVDIVIEFMVSASTAEERLFTENRWMRTWSIGDTGLMTSWMFFPEKAPYDSFDVMVSPSDHPAQRTAVEPTLKFLIEDGSILGWQLVDAKANHVYELRWTLRR